MNNYYHIEYQIEDEEPTSDTIKAKSEKDAIKKLEDKLRKFYVKDMYTTDEVASEIVESLSILELRLID